MACTLDEKTDLIYVKLVQVSCLYKFVSSRKRVDTKACLTCGQGSFYIQPTLDPPEITENKRASSVLHPDL